MASAVLLVAVFPGNVVFALDSTRTPSTSPVLVAAAWGRLPLQAVFIWAALQARRRPYMAAATAIVTLLS